MKSFLLVLQLCIALLLMGAILLQSSKGGLTGGIGGEAYRTKRGAEKLIFRGTIVLAVVFLAISIANLLIL